MSIFIKNKNILFTFYHIEKCAGTSLRYELYNYFSTFMDKQLIFMPEINNVGNNVNLTNNNLLQITKLGKKFIEFLNKKLIILCHISFNDKIFCFEPIFKITCIRNPISRVISHYNYFDKKNYHNREFDQLTNEELKNWFIQKGNLTIFRLTCTTNNLLLAKQNLLKMNHVILVEDYNKDIKTLGHKLEKCFGNKFYHVNLKKNIGTKTKYRYNKIFLEKIIFYLKEELELYYFYKNCRRSFKKKLHL
tara:strand:+ start:1349 stop:2092 length:744 start_codon:yes stop_codon:yes gene_type:complete